jgi:Tfp pilus assembly protein PilF
MQTDGDMIRQARGLFEAGDYAGAERAYRELVGELPEDKRIDLELIIAVCQQAQGRDREALETLQAAIDKDDSRAESWFQLARARRQTGDEEGASEALQQAILLDPNHAMARVERARQCLASGDEKSAHDHFRTALRADPNCVPALVHLAEREFDEGRLDKAQELAAQAVQFRPQSVDAQLMMARIFRRRGHPDFAERCLDNALEVVPDSAELHAARAQLLFERGRSRETLSALGRARELGSADGRLARLEYRCLLQLGQLAAARRVLEKLAEAGHLDAPGTLSLAELRLADGDVGGARALVEALEAAWPEAARLVEAQLAEREGDSARAADLAARLHDESDAHLRSQARLLTARLALRDDDAEACVAALQPLTEQARADGAAADPRVHWMLAGALDRLGRFEAAAEHLPQAGWFLPPLLAAPEREMSESLYRALAAVDTDSWATEAADDDRAEPMFILGWPGSGRDSLLAALAESGAVLTLDRRSAPRRREALGLPAGPEDLAALDETQRRLVRRRYLREAGTIAARVIEPMWLPVTALPLIARVFPGSTVIIADAELRDLELEWRLAGYRGIETLRTLWQREQALLESLLESLPLDFVVLSRGDLESDAAEVAAQLADPLGLDSGDVPALAEFLAPRLSSLRPCGHWKHYGKLFEGRSVA